jgi:hypothetical protein
VIVFHQDKQIAIGRFHFLLGFLIAYKTPVQAAAAFFG